MRIIERVSEMQQQAEAWRHVGRRIALVPTMGYLHQGHLTLMREARNHGDEIVVSIFVNPTQFGPGEDFERYPRDMDRDRHLAEGAGVGVVFAPSVAEMYPDGYQTFVEVMEVTRPLCGQSRPTHFRGVTTVVAKLFNIVKPHAAVFGEKDFQQLAVIHRMARDLNMDVQVIGHPIVREEDGLAMSSRNAYLTGDQRAAALRLSRALDEAESMALGGETRGAVILEVVREQLGSNGEVRIDYAELRDPETLKSVDEMKGPTLLALAAFVGRTRLIDNRVLRCRAR
ncbi:MAG: pantoate--beta-alanine ligase [Syntrophobacteraceae bacterium]|jgi:pantoate--beta-alanine ligase|nr:pantoate--beta-alanine ligase [Syntrophobacteraceae bacterium]